MAGKHAEQANAQQPQPFAWQVALPTPSLYELARAGRIWPAEKHTLSRMRLPRRTLALAAGLLLAREAAAQSLIGVAAPLSGASSILGQQIRAGAAAAVEAGNSAALEVADDACNGEGGAAAARRFVAARVRVVVGFLCTEAIEAAMPILAEARIPVITVGVRTDSLTDRRHKTGWLVYRLGPRADSERQAVGRLLTRLWASELFAIVDDGTIYGRELAESFRLAAEQAGLKPVFVDTFRPQVDNQIGLVGRLRKAGATHVFAGGDRDDIAIMGRDAAALESGIVIAGGEALRAPAGEVPLAQGTLMIALPEWADIADQAVVASLAEREIVPEGYVLPAYAAVEIALAALGEADAAGGPLAASLSGRDFRTAIGTVRFDEKGDLAENPYRLFRHDGSGFKPVTAP
jgi:branched-chain amino acid transport system substrate-binding protein